MNQITRIYLVFIVIINFSCAKNKNPKEEVKSIADNFLTDYYSYRFKAAKEFSDAKTHKLLDKIKALKSNQIQNQYLEKIEKVELLSKDTALISYNYSNNLGHQIDEQIVVVNDRKGWLVSMENKKNLDFYKFIYDYSLIEVEGGVDLPLTAEENVETDLVVSSFIAQINHPKFVVGLLNKDGAKYYDIPYIENFDESYNWFWSDLSTMGLYTSLRFDYNDVLEEFEYYISGIDSKNDLGVFNKIESNLIKEYGVPYNLLDRDSVTSYKSLRWFVKGANNQLELLNNEDGTISLKVKSIN